MDDISHVHVGRIERGENLLREEYLEPLARLLQIQPADLLVDGPHRQAYLASAMARRMTPEAFSTWLAQGPVFDRLARGLAEAPAAAPTEPVRKKRR